MTQTQFNIIFYKDPDGSKPTRFLTWGKQRKLYKQITKMDGVLRYDPYYYADKEHAGYRAISDDKNQVVISVSKTGDMFPALYVHSQGKNKEIPVRYENRGILALAVYNFLRHTYKQTSK